MYATIRYGAEGPVATITLNRPERKNAISPEMASELLYALEAAEADATVRAVVLAGEGKTFCAGGDLGQMAGGAGGEPARPIKGDYADLLLALTNFPKPVVARVQGAALGGGLGLVAAASFAVAASDAVLGTPETNVGLFPMMIMAVLARTMPRRPLLEMMLLGQKLRADEAARFGLVNRVAAPEKLDDEVRGLAEQLAGRAPLAVARGLAAYARMGDLALAEALPFLADELFALLGTDDAREGLTAFMEKRAPRWSGR